MLKDGFERQNPLKNRDFKPTSDSELSLKFVRIGNLLASPLKT